MALFVRPSQVVERLRAVLVLLKVEQPLFPDLTVKAVSDAQVQDELADSEAKEPETTTLFVSNGLSTGSLVTDAGLSPTEITHGISIGLVIGTRDEHSQYAEELATLIKEFILVALHGWRWDDNRQPLTFNVETLFRIKGRAIYFRTYEFSHPVMMEYSDVDDALQLFDKLDDFLYHYGKFEAKAGPQDDIAEIDVNVNIPPP